MLVYSRLICEETEHRLGRPGSAPFVSIYLGQGELAALCRRRDWTGLENFLANGVRRLASAGAESVLVCSSRLHVAADEVAAVADIPILSVADAVATALRRMRIRSVGLLGAFDDRETRFWKSRLESGLVPDVLMPVAADQQHIARIVNEELAAGIVREPSRADLVHTVASFRKAGARAVVLTAPEFRLIFGEDDSVLPVFDAAELHVAAAVDRALGAGTQEVMM
ncbi:aspartate racemase [Opitutaceae bacterium TAV1]|nr:aspartate racemase [Opitutaceae bacterium TAV1]